MVDLWVEYWAVTRVASSAAETVDLKDVEMVESLVFDSVEMMVEPKVGK